MPVDGAGAPLRGLTQLRMVGLRDGRLLLTGSDPAAERARQAFVIDLRERSVQRDLNPSRIPSVLVELADGTVVELDDRNASLRRHDLRSAFDDAPYPVVGPEHAEVALDLPARWRHEPGEGLHALVGARLDVPHLRFAALRVSLVIAGEAELLLEPEGAAPVVIALGEGRIALGGCELERATGPVHVERTGSELVLTSGSRSKTCSTPGLAGHVGVALRTLGRATIASLRIERR
jgi:hypothetical protein